MLQARSASPVGHLYPNIEDVEAAIMKLRAKTEQLTLALKANDDDRARQISDECRNLQRESEVVNALFEKKMGITADELERLDRLHEPPFDDRYSLRDVLAAPSTYELNNGLSDSLDRLLGEVPAGWLEDNASRPHSLDERFLREPVSLLGSLRLSPPEPRCGRFASMILMARQHLACDDLLDFHMASALVPELSMLAARLPEIREMGPEASRKLRSLALMPNDDEVAATIYELLVGAAAVRLGRTVEMLPASKGQEKRPDFRVHDLGIPIVMECKRRLRPNAIQFAEARRAEELFGRVRSLLRRGNTLLEVSFTRSPELIAPDVFEDAVERALKHAEPLEVEWGSISATTLKSHKETSRTRLYSPEFLEQVFAWDQGPNPWDGLLAVVDPPREVVVTCARRPCGLKWRVEDPNTLAKKVRGIDDLWNRALAQIPAAEVGLIYLSYSENARESIADLRTEVLRSAVQEWARNTQIAKSRLQIPLVTVNRLYSRPTRMGLPDLIDNAVVIRSETDSTYLRHFPTAVLAHTARGSRGEAE